MRKCKVCEVTELDAEFYASINSYCKEHWKEKVRENRAANSDYYKEFDRNRASQPERVASRNAYQKTIAFAESHQKACRRYKESNPIRRAAQVAVGHAIRAGKLKKLPCFICGSEKTEGHHPDYSAHLDVIWLCHAHHKQAHAMSKRIERKAA